MPVFDKHYYTVSVAEDIELHSPLAVAITAQSPLNRKLIYSLVSGNEFEEFALDFNTGMCVCNYAFDFYAVLTYLVQAVVIPLLLLELNSSCSNGYFFVKCLIFFLTVRSNASFMLTS